MTIEPDGQWSTKTHDSDRRQSARAAEFDDDDDAEISEITMIGGPRVEASKTPTTSLAMPASANRSETSAPRGLGSTSGKRPAAAVIDLTLSSDDEDDNQPIQRPAKRQNLGASTTFNGYRDQDRLGFLSSESPVNYN